MESRELHHEDQRRIQDARTGHHAPRQARAGRGHQDVRQKRRRCMASSPKLSAARTRQDGARRSAHLGGTHRIAGRDRSRRDPRPAALRFPEQSGSQEEWVASGATEPDAFASTDTGSPPPMSAAGDRTTRRQRASSTRRLPLGRDLTGVGHRPVTLPRAAPNRRLVAARTWRRRWHRLLPRGCHAGRGRPGRGGSRRDEGHTQPCVVVAGARKS
jgi:hypothetical protein